MRVPASTTAFSLVSAFLLAALSFSAVTPAQSKKGRKNIVLPPVKKNQAEQNQEKLSDIEQFERDTFRLRRSKRLSGQHVEVLLRELRERYEHPGKLALRLAGKVGVDQVWGMMVVLDRYGEKRDAAELQFLLMTKSMGMATQKVARTMASLDPNRAKDNLLDLMQAKFAPVRLAATRLLMDRVDKADMPRLLELSHSRKGDVRRKVVRLLGRVQAPDARKRLLQIMKQDPAMAGEACDALVVHGQTVIPDLQKILSKPANGREFGYAALAITKLENKTERPYILREMVPQLKASLDSRDPFLRATCATALATLAYRSTDNIQSGVDSQKVVDGLLLVVAPIEFVTDLSRMQSLANERLVQFTGEDFRGRSETWRNWWKNNRADFVGMRSRIKMSKENAGYAVLTWRDRKTTVVFLGERAAPVPKADGLTQYILAADEFNRLMGELGALGFMTTRWSSGEGDSDRALDFRVAGARTRLRLPSGSSNRFVVEMRKAIITTAHAQRWQLYRDPAVHPDAAPFWRAERKWMAANPGKENLRLKERIIARLGTLKGEERVRGVRDLTSIPDLKTLITDADGARLLEIAANTAKMDDVNFQLLEVALLAPGDLVWRRALGVLEQRMLKASDIYVTRMFSLIGSDKVLAALDHPSEPVRTAAMHEIARSKDLRAVPNLIKKLSSKQPREQRTAIFALGMLKAAEARKPLVALEPKAEPVVRRDIWVALGRIGGMQVSDILIDAVRSVQRIDRMAALTAMGEIKNDRIALFLARRFASQSGAQLDEYGRRTMMSLRKQGEVTARKHLRKQLPSARGAARTRIILLLGEFHDTIVVEELINFMEDRRYRYQATVALSEITGVDFELENERKTAATQWYRVNKSQPRQVWFLDALRRSKVDTSLTVRHLTGRRAVESVPELARVMTEVKQPHLRMMTLSMLREVSGVDYGQLSRISDKSAVEAVADRYRYHAEAVKAAQAATKGRTPR